MRREAFFLSTQAGQRFCLHYRPDSRGPCRGAIVYVPPFAEELNRSRRMAALQARAFARAGYAVLQMDLLGCGDSSGDFADATWEAWQHDVATACHWMREQHDVPLCLWGLRVGCLLAAEVARYEAVNRLLLWQPVVSGALFLTQFLRLRIAGEMLSGEIKGVMAGLRHDLANGCAVEVAGYTLSPSLALALESSQLVLPERPLQLQWLEMSGRQGERVSPIVEQYLERWKTAGHRVQGRGVQGAAFWQAIDVEESVELLAASLLALEAMEVS